MSYNLFAVHDLGLGMTYTHLNLLILMPLIILPSLFLAYGNVFLHPGKCLLFIIIVVLSLAKTLKSVSGALPQLFVTLLVVLSTISMYTVTPLVHSIAAWPWSLFTLSLPYWLLSIVEYYTKPFPSSILHAVTSKRRWLIRFITILSHAITVLARPFTLTARMWVHCLLPGMLAELILKSIDSIAQSLFYSSCNFIDRIILYCGGRELEILYYLLSFPFYFMSCILGIVIVFVHVIGDLCMTAIQVGLYAGLLIHYIKEAGEEVRVKVNRHSRPKKYNGRI